MNKIDQHLGVDTASARPWRISGKHTLGAASWFALSLLALGCAGSDHEKSSADPSGGNSAGSSGDQANGNGNSTSDNGGGNANNGDDGSNNGAIDEDGGANNGAGNGESNGGSTGETATPIPEDCMAYELIGLKYSPGGDVLPNKCKPFDTLTNNPYAIRCIDADPNYKTGLLGDEYCILPPAPEHGFQVHVGPSNYADPEPGYVIKPGEETNEEFPATSGNAQDVYYYYRQYRMRPGSHHLIVSKAEEQPEVPGGGIGLGMGTRLGVSQNLVLDAPVLSKIPEENTGVGMQLAAATPLSINLHYMNATDRDLVKEAWVNFWYKAEAEVTEKAEEIFAVGGVAMNIQPGEHVVLGANGAYSCEITTAGRVLNVYGHRHANALRFSAWRKRNGVRELIYEDYDWHDPLVLEYNSTTTNQSHDPETMSGGGFSGVLDLQPGDALEWECEVDNQSGVPLRFVNESLTGEMCILLGEAIGQEVTCIFR